MTAPVPRNRTALAAQARVQAQARANASAVGNPATARLESGVGNCFPGLEWDVRALDGRFFPGLLFWVVADPLLPVPEAPKNQAGILLRGLDYLRDPMLPERSPEPWVQKLLSIYGGSQGVALANGRWYLQFIEQGGRRIECTQATGVALDGELVWRFIRCIAPEEPLRIGLVNRDAPDPPATLITLDGKRRTYTDDQGSIDLAYPPGELTGAMCIPWQHDFRDCACYYWATNHPDVVLAEGDAVLPDNTPAGVAAAVTLLDWLRRDRSPAGETAAPQTRSAARPQQLDHFEINRRWQELAFVIGGREIGPVWQPLTAELVQPGSRAEMIHDLRHHLAPMEYTLGCQYLYGLFSLKSPDEAGDDRWPTMAADLAAVRQSLTLIAVGEMTHMRWANQLLWELEGPAYVPVLTPAASEAGEAPALCVLDAAALAAYEAIESPDASLDRAYARWAAELTRPEYPRHLHELAVRIDTDGVSHFARFREMRERLARYGSGPEAPYLRRLRLGTPAQAAPALGELRQLLRHLQMAYTAEAGGNLALAQAAITQAREAMVRLQTAGERLAQQGIGIPFFAATP